MTPGARLQATIEILEALSRGDSDASSLLDGYFRKRRYAGSGDRRDITERLYQVLRSRARLDWWIDRTGLGLEPSSRNRTLTACLLIERRDPTALGSAFSGDRHCPDALSEEEAELVAALYGRALVHADMPPAVAQEVPAWLASRLQALWGPQFDDEMAALNQTAALDIRVNPIKSTREAVQQSLAESGIVAEPTPFSPLGLRIPSKARLGGLPAFKKGWFEPQDEGSQLVALLTDARPGQTVIDFCAGAGGKTLVLGAQMAPEGRIQDRGRLIACDISRYRLDRMVRRLDRAGLKSVRRQVINAADDPWVDANAGMADRVLVDVPCTGTGTWRRDPAEKWRFQGDDLDPLLETQARILAQAARLVAPGGVLVYVTCSVLREENEDQIESFLQTHPDFQKVNILDIWEQVIGGMPPAGIGEAMRLTPARHGTDGFFLASLSKAL